MRSFNKKAEVRNFPYEPRRVHETLTHKVDKPQEVFSRIKHCGCTLSFFDFDGGSTRNF